MSLPVFQVDAFTDAPFRGNPAAVCLLPEAPQEAQENATSTWMQSVARELSLSETAFLAPLEDGYRLRWFTPTVEVDLCGHATLASAHVLWDSGRLDRDQPARFHTRSGLLTATREDSWIRMDFPATPPERCETPVGLLEGLRITTSALSVGRTRFDYLVELANERVLRAVKPDFRRLANLTARGVMLTARAATAPFDYVSRFFAPGTGIDEDPVTGSAHCCLGPFWAERLGKAELRAYQASSRGGVVRVRVAGDRVYLLGQAITILRGELLG